MTLSFDFFYLEIATKSWLEWILIGKWPAEWPEIERTTTSTTTTTEATTNSHLER